ncbi:MAG: hypothetical protein GX043_06055 [Desulfovibrionales bacterium]|nr:hypothetical protein [Desulfovibrionales bacterium]
MPPDSFPIIVAGGHEFLSPDKAKDSPGIMTRLLAAYSQLPYDIFLLAPTDEQSIIQNYLSPNPSWHGPLTQPQVVSHKVQDGTIAFVLFPDKQSHSLTGNKKLGNFIRNLRDTKEYNLIVGISSWGSDQEENFLAAEPNTVDILLGSGDGPGYTGLYLQENAALWVRAFSKGKAVSTITIPSLPAPQEKVIWEPEETIFTKTETLDHSIPLDDEMHTLLTD